MQLLEQTLGRHRDSTAKSMCDCFVYASEFNEKHFPKPEATSHKMSHLGNLCVFC